MTVKEARDVAISVVQGWPSRKERLLRRLEFLVIARNEAISIVILSCHREVRGDLACSQPANSQKRECRAALAMTVKEAR